MSSLTRWGSDSPSEMTRRRALLAAAGLATAALVPGRAAAETPVGFDELYSKEGVLGLELSPKLKSLDGQAVAMRGYMAPPLKPEADFFVLTRQPVSLCPFCDSDASWPDDIVVIRLHGEAALTRPGEMVEVRGRLELGSKTDERTGFVSLVRIVDARYRTV
jgi:hypothetical protein